MIVSDRVSNILFCGHTTEGVALWCCDNEGGDGPCCDDDNPEYIPEGFWGTYWFSPGTSESPSTSTPSSAPTSTTQHESVSSTGSPASSSSTPTNTSQPATSKLPVAIGTGVGVPLGVLAVGLIGFLVWRERRRRPQPQPHPSEQWYTPREKSNDFQGSMNAPTVEGAGYGAQSTTNPYNVRSHELPGPPPPELDASRH